MTIAVKPWPKKLMDVERGARCRTVRQIANGMMIVPAGALGRITQSYPNWHSLEFTGDVCKGCGVAARIRGLSRKDLELLEEAML